MPVGKELLSRSLELLVDPRFEPLYALHAQNPFLDRATPAGAFVDGPRGPLPPLVCYTEALESRQLVQAGPRPSPRDPSLVIRGPECMQGDRCVGRTLQFRGLPVGVGSVLSCLWVPLCAVP